MRKLMLGVCLAAGVWIAVGAQGFEVATVKQNKSGERHSAGS